MRGKAEGVGLPRTSGPPVTLAEADLAPYLIPDIVLPTQALPVVASAERRLVATLILTAIEDARRLPGLEREEARFWIDSRRRGPFSFEDCCEVCGFDPDAVRAAVGR